MYVCNDTGDHPVVTCFFHPTAFSFPFMFTCQKTSVASCHLPDPPGPSVHLSDIVIRRLFPFPRHRMHSFTASSSHRRPLWYLFLLLLLFLLLHHHHRLLLFFSSFSCSSFWSNSFSVPSPHPSVCVVLFHLFSSCSSAILLLILFLFVFLFLFHLLLLVILFL